MYTLNLRFDEKLVRALEVPDVSTCDDFMKNVPLCCMQNNKLKKICWEELHSQPIEDKQVFSSNVMRTFRRTTTNLGTVRTFSENQLTADDNEGDFFATDVPAIEFSLKSP